jgi:hypothetical protein
MNGFIKKKLAACVAGGLVLGGGCHYRDLVDPCYPERYEYAARQEIYGAVAPQVSNGHVLDQTIWNYHFEPGKDRLTPGGLEYLAYLARRRPCPDPTVYLQTAQDLLYDQAKPEGYATARAALDAARMKAVKDFLTAQTAGRQVDFQVVVHDPADPGIAAAQIVGAVGSTYFPVTPAAPTSVYGSSRGLLPSTAGAGASNVVGGGTGR